VAEYRDVERLDDRGDFLPARTAGVHLCPSARMQSDGANASVLAAKRDRYRIAHLLVPTASDLTGHRERRALRDRANDRLHEVEILETSRAAVALDDFLYGTTEVDVDKLRGEDVGDERRGFAHRNRVGAENLD